MRTCRELTTGEPIVRSRPAARVPSSPCRQGAGPRFHNLAGGLFLSGMSTEIKERCGAWRRRMEAVSEGLFYVRRHTCADGSFEWYVLNGHTRRRASNFFPTRAAAVAERRKLQAKVDLSKAKVLKRTPKV